MTKRELWEEQVDEWWDDNQIQEYANEPPGEVMYDAFAFIQELMALRKGEK